MAVTKKDNSKTNLVVNQIVIKAANRSTSDISTWRSALQSAEGVSGKVKKLYELFDDLLIDGVLADAVDKRIGAVTNSAITFQNEKGEDVPEITALIDTPAFEELLVTIMNVRFWGRSGGEFDFSTSPNPDQVGFNFEPIPAKHIRPENQVILINDSDENGVDYSQDDHLFVLGKPRQFGLFLKTAPYVIWKRGGFGDYAEWLEIFGMPQRIFKYSGNDPQQREILIKAAEQAGSAPWVVVPKETDIEQNQQSGNSTGSAHKDFIDACNAEILITILGQTMTTLDGSSKSQSETHKEVEESKNRADMRYVRRVLNQIVAPVLEKRGFPVKGGKFIFPEAAQPITVDEVVKLADIMEIPTSFLHNKFSIPMPKDGEPIARRASGGIDAINRVSPDPNPDEPITNADKSFWKGLFNFFASAPGSGALNTETHTNNCIGTDAINRVSPIELADGDINDQVIRDVAKGATGFHPALFDFISSDLIRAVEPNGRAALQQLADFGFTYGYQNDAFTTAMKLNIFKFSAAKDIAEIQKLNEAFRDSKSYGDFKKKAASITTTFNDVYQKTEYNTAVNICENTATYNRLNVKKELYPYWEYRTVGDGHTREEHAALSGLILRADDPKWRQIYPPNGWNCRCSVAPRMKHEVVDYNEKAQHAIVDEFQKSKEWKVSKASGFGVNRALSAEVFTEDQFYIAKFKDQSSRWLKDVNYHNYGLKSYDQYRKKATNAVQMYKGSLADFEKTLVTENGKTFATDYDNQKILLNLKAWEESHPGKIAERSPFIAEAMQTILKPDEVWINVRQDVYKLTEDIIKAAKKARKSIPVNRFDQMVFLKYYTDATIAVIARIQGSDIYEIVTWFPVDENSATNIKFRSGMLIKKPSL